MNFSNVLDLLGGICLFLFGMKVMGSALERKAGSSLSSLFNKVTKNRFIGLMIGLTVTAMIQSSAATTIMVIGFVNSGIMTLSQSVSVIMGANIGTTVTAWILSLSQISGKNIFLMLLHPSTFVPILSLIGISFIFGDKDNKKETGYILLGFSVLMYGMSTMSNSVAGLRNVQEFTKFIALLSNPFLGLLAGAIFTAILQSSSASIGVLQALTVTKTVTFSNGIPIILGQNIGSCVITLISSVGTNKNSKRAAFIHTFFNTAGAAFFLLIFLVIKYVTRSQFLHYPLSAYSIAIFHTAFNISCALLLFPFQKLLVQLSNYVISNKKTNTDDVELDERLLITPALALDRCKTLVEQLAQTSVEAIKKSFTLLDNYNDGVKTQIYELENKTDHYEDILGTFLIKFSSRQINSAESMKATEYLKCIGDFERMADHSINISRNALELHDKKIEFSENTKDDINVLIKAIKDICDITLDVFLKEDIAKAYDVEPLEQVIDKLKEEIRTRHIKKMQQGISSMHEGFILSDLLTNLERISDHCSNIAGCMIDSRENNLLLHTTLGVIKNTDAFKLKYEGYLSRYTLKEVRY